MAEIPSAEKPEDWAEIGKQIVSAILSVVPMEHFTKALIVGEASAHGVKVATARETMAEAGALLGKGVILSEELVAPVFAGFVSAAISHIFGTEVSASAFSSHDNVDGREQATKGMVDALFDTLTPQNEVAPSDAGARTFLNFTLSAALESWFSGMLLELLTAFIPIEGVGHIEQLGKLNEEIVGALGLPRLARRVLQPLVNVAAVTPMQWYINRAFRPTKLGTSTIVRQMARGRWSEQDARDELSLDGYSDDRIEALINEHLKFLDIAEVSWMFVQEIITQDEAVDALGKQGYDAQTASQHLSLQTLRRDDAMHREVAAAATTAFVDGRIDDGALMNLLDATIPSLGERELLVGGARAKRALRVLPLSPAEAAAAVKAGILAVPDYRHALELAGRSPDAVDVLELLLRKEIDEKSHIADLRRQQQAEKDAAAKAKADAVAKAKAAADAKTALARRGSIQELTRAVVRGLVPLARLDEVLVAEFDSDTAAIYAADAEQQRQAYLAQQQKAADAAKRAAATGLSTGELQTALVDGVLTADQVRAQLVGRHLAPADVDVLLATMQQRAAEHAAAVKLRDAAALKARTKTISLAQAESLVRGGHWTTAQYQTYVAALGYGDADVAYLVELLTDQIAKDRTAAALRKSVNVGDPGKGLSLAQFRQAVIIGAASMDAFQTFLVNEGYTADAQAILVAELRDAVTAADAARARRTAAAGAVDGSTVALSDVTRAARLGLLTPDQYRAQLAARGFSDDEIALEVDLLINEIAAAKSADTATGAGLGTPSAAPVDAVAAATARHVTIDGELAVRGLSLSEIEAGVKAGLVTIDAYQAWLESNGYGQADAELLRALLVAKLPPAGG